MERLVEDRSVVERLCRFGQILLLVAGRLAAAAADAARQID
jgi:hypothetical protein